MNFENIQHYLNEYKLHFKKIHREEIYKWEAIKAFQDNWNIDAHNFVDMLEKSLFRTVNLLDSGKYYPRRMLVKNAKLYPTEIKQLMIDLFNENENFLERIINFQQAFLSINNRNFNGLNTYQDHRAILVYLSLMFPEKYYLYKFSIFTEFVKLIDYDYLPKRGRIENIGQYYNLCDLIRHEILKDQEILRLHKNRLSDKCYFDNNIKILTQDFLYATVTHLKENTSLKKPKEINVKSYKRISTKKLNNSISQPSFKGIIIDHIENEKEKIYIGKLGENFVFMREIEKLKEFGFKNKMPKHDSFELGDGIGYDIKSYDKNGNEIFIEVKTTRGSCSQPFFITKNELELSKKIGNNYYLYRLYNFDEKMNSADIYEINGNLEYICDDPTLFRVSI